MNSDDGGRLPKRKGSVSVFSMKRLMHSELLQVVADRERPRSERCYWLPRAADSSSNKQPIIGPESKQSILCCEQSRSEASTIRIPSPSLHLERGPDFRRESSSSSGRLQASRKSSISAESDQSGPEAGGSTAPSYPKLDTTLPIDSDRRDVNASMEISAVLSSLIIQDLKDQYKQLPILEGFLEKLCPNKSMLKFWQTRFFFIEGDCLCYSREFIEVQNRRHPDYEELIINRIPFLLMLSITGDQDRRQLIIEVHDKKRSGCVRQYVLRAKAADVRDRWLEGIKQYAKHFRDMIQLGNLTPQSFDSKNLDQMGIMPNSISSPATYNSRAQSLP